MKKIIRVFIFILLTHSNKVFAQSTFQKIIDFYYPGYIYEINATDIILDTTNDIVMSAYQKETISQVVIPSIIKTDEHGNLKWHKQYIYSNWQGGLFNLWDPLESTCRHASLSIL